LYAVTLKEVLDKEKVYRDYYTDIEFTNVIWLRLSDIRTIDKKNYFDSYEMRAGEMYRVP
jgi:hypothetical protein